MTEGRAVAAALVAVYFLWGSTYLAIRLMVETAPPLLANGVRYAAAGMVITAYVAARRRAALRLGRRQLGSCLVLGTVLLLGGNSMIVFGEQTVASAVAAVLFAAVPLWVVLLRRGHGDSVHAKTLVGVTVGFIGVALIAAPAEDGVGPGAVFLVLGSLSWAAGSFYASRLPLPGDTFLTAGIEMLLGGVVTAGAGLAMGESPTALAHLSGRSWGGLAFLVLGGAVLGFSAYRWLLDNAPVSTVATHAYVNPLVAVVLGTLILDERLSWAVVAGGGLILAAVVLCVSERGGGRLATSTAPAGLTAASNEPYAGRCHHHDWRERWRLR